jgi:hypothetical protein
MESAGGIVYSAYSIIPTHFIQNPESSKQMSPVAINKPTFANTLVNNVHSTKPLCIEPEEWGYLIKHPVKDVLQSNTTYISIRNSLLKGIPAELYVFT